MPSVFYIIVVLGIITSPSVVSGLTCPDPPQQFSREIVNETGIIVKLLKNFLGQVDLENKVDIQVKNLYDKYPNADKLVLAQLLVSQFCTLLNESHDLTTERKFELLNDMHRKIISLVNPDQRSSSYKEAIEIFQNLATDVVEQLNQEIMKASFQGSQISFESSEFERILRLTSGLQAIKSDFLELHRKHIKALDNHQIFNAHYIYRDIQKLLMVQHRDLFFNEGFVDMGKERVHYANGWDHISIAGNEIKSIAPWLNRMYQYHDIYKLLE